MSRSFHADPESDFQRYRRRRARCARRSYRRTIRKMRAKFEESDRLDFMGGFQLREIVQLIRYGT